MPSIAGAKRLACGEFADFEVREELNQESRRLTQADLDARPALGL